MINQTSETAKVECTQLTEKINGPEFENYKVIFVHTLKKSDGKWKIFAGKINDITFED